MRRKNSTLPAASAILLGALLFGALGCDSGSGGDAGVPLDANVTRDAGAEEDAAVDAGAEEDAAVDAGAEEDAAVPSDAGPPDAGPPDAGPPDAGPLDAGPPDAGTDAGPPPPPPVTCMEPGLVTETIRESASVGTPDSYFRDVRPGDPFCAEITGGGSGTWSVNVSNGTSSGLHCSGSARCAIRVPAGDTTLIVTAITTDIGSYTLTIRRIPP